MDKQQHNTHVASETKREATQALLKDVTDTPVSKPGAASTMLRSMHKGRFLFGMLLTGAGMGLMLAVATGVLQTVGVDGNLSLPAVAICMIIGLMLLGGGFGVMATSAGVFDDDEFDRLVNAHSITQAAPIERQEVETEQPFRNAEEKSPAASLTRSDQVVA